MNKAANKVLSKRTVETSGLFVIAHDNSGRRQFYTESSEHGCGWHEGYPKQSFSKTEVASVLRLLIERGHFQDCMVLQLTMPCTPGCQEPDTHN